MADAIFNFGVGIVKNSPGAAGTSIELEAGQGARFTGVPPYNCVVRPYNEIATPSNAEIVRVTKITGDVLTVTRKQEGTSARTIKAGDLFMAAVTAKVVTEGITGPEGLRGPEGGLAKKALVVAHSWAFEGEPRTGKKPGTFVHLLSEETQTLVELLYAVQAGEWVEFSVLRNGIPIAALTKLKAESKTKSQTVTLAEPLADGDILSIEIIALKGSPLNLTITGFVEHVSAGEPKGIQGIQGEPGIEGPIGKTGLEGPEGKEGKPGGPPGPEGPKGEEGKEGGTAVVGVAVSANHALVTGDTGKSLDCTAVSPAENQVTVSQTHAEAMAAGQVFEITRLGTGPCRVIAEAGVEILPASSGTLRVPGSVAGLRKVTASGSHGTQVFVITGDYE